MGRKRNNKHDYLPTPGDCMPISHLPRDVRLGARKEKGEMLLGWDETTGTRQLWLVTAEDSAQFLGYVHNKPC